MPPFIFAVGATLPDASFASAGASYLGRDDLIERREGAIVVQVGDPEAAFARMTYQVDDDCVVLESDVTGQAALRYAVRDGVIYVASHDVLLAPYVPFAVDGESYDALRRVGWSVGGHSLIDGIATCAGGETVRVRRTGVTTSPREFPIGSADDQLDRCVRWLEGRLPAGPVAVELSAGFDSRAALAATLACKPASDLRVFSEGPETSQDVEVARRICARDGIPFERRETTIRSADEVLESWTRFSLQNNGHIEVDILASQREPAPTVCGDGGEIFRGYFYPYRPFGRLRGGAGTSALDAIASKLADVPRLSEAVARVSGGTEAETMDRFYLTERFGVWNQKLFRSSPHRISPFYARSAMVGLGRGLDASLHAQLIERFLPKSADEPINGEAPPSLYGRGPVASGRLEARLLAGKVRRRLSRRGDLQGARGRAMSAVLEAVPDGFLHGDGRGWADLGARRFLQAYRDAARSTVPPMHLLAP